MHKINTHIFFAIVAFVLSARGVNAQEQVAGSSATLKFQNRTAFDYRVENLRMFLNKYNSPLTSFSADFVAYADTYGLDYRLVPSITGVESTFGKQIPVNSFNAYGWVNGNYSFESWPDSIQIVSETLKTKYIERGAVTIPQIARRYAPPSSTWGGKVKYFMGKIESFPVSYDI